MARRCDKKACWSRRVSLSLFPHPSLCSSLVRRDEKRRLTNLAAVAVPPGLSKWFKSSYPTLQFDPDWLQGCLSYLLDANAGCSTQQLIKLTESQLLLSDLTTSTLAVSALPTGPIAFPSNAGRTLLQITKIQDVGNSAWSQIEVVREKREERKKGGVEPPYARGMGKVTLGDGHWECEAIEYERVVGMGLEEVKLGCKLLVHDVRIVKGIMLLTPGNTVMKGQSVEEFLEHQEEALETALWARLGKVPPAPKDNAGAPQQAVQPASPPANAAAPRRLRSRSPAAPIDRKPRPPPPAAPRQVPPKAVPVPPRAGPSNARVKREATPPEPTPEEDFDDFNDSFMIDEEAELELRIMEGRRELASKIKRKASVKDQIKVWEGREAGTKELQRQSTKRAVSPVERSTGGTRRTKVKEEPPASAAPPRASRERPNSSSSNRPPTQVIELDLDTSSDEEQDGGYASRVGATGKKRGRVQVKEEPSSRGSGGGNQRQGMDVIVLD